ncbi:sensor histidine kinase [uncultured Polaribacter sp.]|uniref:tetratricopeptide repeat-containing sensor histidine kinase n=1 Tax=uncultured Polaribacter sp. TaxID=174711 RepID=UPI0026064172|nr:sensor histidine kinase [uncultured Polaribacter sp.]
MKIKFFLILFLFISFFCNSQQNNSLDSISKLENKVSKEYFLQLILSLEYDKALTDSKKLLKLSKKATKIAYALKDKSAIAKSYRLQSLAYHFSSNFDLAIAYTIKAANLFEEINDIENSGFSYIELGWKLKYFNLQNAILYMKKGITILENSDTKNYNLIEGYNNYGTLKSFKNELDSAMFFHKKSLSLAKHKNDDIGIPFAHTNIATVLIKNKKFYLAEKHLDSSMQIRKNKNDIYGIADSYLYYGDLFFEKKAYNKAINNFKKAKIISEKNSYFPLKKYATLLLQKSYDSLQNYKESLKYYHEYSKMKDSVDNISAKNKIAELEIEYETTKKEKEIAQQKKQLLEKELAIKNRNLYAILLAAALLILGIVFFAAYKRNQFKKKQLQKEIDLKDALATIKTQNRLQEQRLRISRDLHDNIGSQLTFIISSVDNLKYITKDANEKLKDKLSNISSFTSETIHQLRDTIWAMNKNEVTVEDLHARILSFIEKAKNATENIEFSIDYNIDKNKSFTSLEGMNIFRVVQEAINNAIKYANATNISVIFSKNKNNLHISIIDNGNGFDIKKVALGNGLSNMEKRMSEIEGNVSVNSEINKGTAIQLSLNPKKATNNL